MRVALTGESAEIEVREDGSHLMLTMTEADGPDDQPLASVSVFVRVMPETDVAVSVNGDWWVKSND